MRNRLFRSTLESAASRAPEARPHACLLLATLALTCMAGQIPEAFAIDTGLLAGPVTASFSRLPGIERVQSRTQAAPIINVSNIVVAEPATDTPFPIQVGPPDGLPKNSFIRIRGVPPSVALSEGHSIAPGAWAVPFVGLPTLRVSVPVGLSGRSQIVVALVTVDGIVLAEAKTTLLIGSPSLIVSGRSEPQPKSFASIGSAVAPVPADADSRPVLNPRPTVPAVPERSGAQQQALRFVAKGNELLADGDVSTARLFYQRAVDAGLHEGALAMAATYDPDELARIGVKDLQPDAKSARLWYERARQLGAPEAEARLRRLGTR